MLLEFVKVGKCFKKSIDTEVLKQVSFSLSIGEVVALTGKSGSGKTTLLHIAAFLDTPSCGDVIFEGISCSKMGRNKKNKLHREKVGFVYQYHCLMPEFSAVENVMIPQIINGVDKKTARVEGENMLDRMGLSHKVDVGVSILSGGERQRVAVARALINNPVMLVADEPTGSLDEENACTVFEILLQYVRSAGASMLFATHSEGFVSSADRRINIENGTIV